MKNSLPDFDYRALQTLINFSPVGIFQTDAAGHCFFVNKRWSQLTGLSAHEALGEGWAQSLHPEDKEHIFNKWRETAAKGEEFAADFRFTKPNGDVTWVSCQAVALCGDDRTITGYLGTISDITERVRLEQTLSQSERRFRDVFNSMFEFIGLLDTQGNLLEANETALQAGGLTLAEVQNKPFWEARWWSISKETQQQLKKAIQLAASGELVRYEVGVLGADNEEIIIDFSLKPCFDEDGRVVLIIPEGRDITLQRRAESALRESQQQFQAFMDNIPINAWILNENSQAVFFNDHLLNSINRQMSEVVGKTAADFFLLKLPPNIWKMTGKFYGPTGLSRQLNGMSMPPTKSEKSFQSNFLFRRRKVIN